MKQMKHVTGIYKSPFKGDLEGLFICFSATLKTAPRHRNGRE